MNEKPHTHRIKLTTGGRYDAYWLIEYGDTRVYVRHWNRWKWGAGVPSEKAVDKATRKAIKMHDSGSLRAGNYAIKRADRQVQIDEINAKLLEPEQSFADPTRFNVVRLKDEWASDILAK